jgi:predicted ferric reductase
MSNELNSYLPTPTKQRFAATFHVVRPISFWVQLALGAVSGLALALAIFSRSSTVQTTTNSVMGFGVFLGIIGILVLCFRVYWANRYRHLDKLLQSPNRELHPRKDTVIQALQIGLIVSFTGLLVAFLASEVTVIAVLAKALALPQGVAVYRPENIIRSLDLFVVLANVNLIGAHLVGSATSLGLLNWLD